MLGFYTGMDSLKLENFNNIPPSPKQTFKNFKPSYTINHDIFKKQPIDKNTDKKVKLGVLSAAIISTLIALYGITKKKGINPFKNFNLFKQEIEPMDMLKITGLTVPTSLAVGIFLDNKENTIPKIKEGISQMVGNLIIPILLINETLKFKDRINGKNFKNPVMKTLSKTHKAIYTAVSLVGGLLIGNIVANDINSCLFKEHKKRPLKLKDFSVHFDDICFATSLIFKGNKLGEYASLIIPATLLLSAYETGTKNKYEN